MITASAINNKIVVSIDEQGYSSYRLERHSLSDDTYLALTAEGFCVPTEENPAIAVGADFLDTHTESNTLYSYRYCDFTAEEQSYTDKNYSNWVRNGGDEAIGYSFGNYKVPTGKWGVIVTPDDLRYTYLWGTDFKATNGQSFTDEQIEYFIKAAMTEIERKLDITIEKKKIRYNATERNLEKGVDYDMDESVYDFRYQKIARYGLIRTRKRPIAKLHSIKLLSRLAQARDLTTRTIVDKQKGTLRLMERPPKPTETSSGIQTATGMYGNETFAMQLFYAIDYDAGFETADDVPQDLREIVAKSAAVNLLDIVGDGLMSGFSSSSLSMDGLSESFSSTQSATSAYFGARIKEYKDDIALYIKQNRYKFNNLPMGSI